MIPAATAGEAHVSRCLDCRLIPYMQSPGQLSEDLWEEDEVTTTWKEMITTWKQQVSQVGEFMTHLQGHVRWALP